MPVRNRASLGVGGPWVLSGWRRPSVAGLVLVLVGALQAGLVRGRSQGPRGGRLPQDP